MSPSSFRVTVADTSLNTAMDEMRKSAVTHHAYVQQKNKADFLITDRILVTFKKPVSNEVLSAFMGKYSLLLLSKYSEREFLFQLTDGTGMNPVKLVVVINETESKLVESCEHDLNKRMKPSSLDLPTDSKYIQQWHLHRRFSNPAFDQRSSSDCELAWQALGHFGNSDVVIGITDDGCKLDHSDFNSDGKFAHWGYMQDRSLIHRDTISANPQNMYQSGADHGTCCCGVIAAEKDAVLTVGAAPGCRLLPIKWESDDSGLYVSDSKLITVLNFISDKVDILSNSWGSSPESNYASNVLSKITTLANTGGRRGKGILFLWAAGNENCPIQYTGNKDIPCDNGYDENGRWKGVETSRNFEHNLVGIPGVMHIAALASNAQRSHYSNYGEGISLCAPSSNSHEYWRMAVTGLGILTTSGTSRKFDDQFGGTSSATPLIAGIAGLVISANPTLSAIELVSLLQRTAAKELEMTDYPKTIPNGDDPDTSWDISPVAPFDKGSFKNIGHPDGTWSPWFGFGKADAAAAVTAALRVGGSVSDLSGSVSLSSNPMKSIPDFNTTGITDIIQVQSGITVASLKIAVKITHSFIGDLVIKVISPRGTPVILHNRNGGSAKNINKIYDIQNTPTLSIINGESANGNWALEVTDLAQQDAGTLDSWTLQIGNAESGEWTLEDVAAVVIPDNKPAGIQRVINNTVTGTCKSLDVFIDITHSYVGDLMVQLISPKGTVINLHNKEGGSADNIIRSYDFNMMPALEALKGESLKGDWKLKVSDTAREDTGKLNKWSLHFIKE
jgi:subtilisin-like proprotein convertase family protein